MRSPITLPRPLSTSPAWIACSLLLGTLLVDARCTSNGFINFDDEVYVGLAQQTGLDLSWALTATEASNWHPLTWVSLQVDAQLFGGEAFGFHLTNLLLHTSNTLLLFGLLCAWTAAPWKSAVVAGLFGLHPLHVESVAWVAERKDVLSTFFFLLTLAAYTHYVHQPGLGRYLLVLVLDALGLMSKPMLVTLPFLLLLLDFWPLARSETGAASKTRSQMSAMSVVSRTAALLCLEKVPLVALAIASCVMTLAVQHAAGATVLSKTLPFSARLANALLAYTQYLGKTFWPESLAIFYPHPLERFSLVEVIPAACLLVAITIAALAWRRRLPYLLTGWFWYLGTLVPVIGLIQVGRQSMADRYTYVPLIGILLLAVWGAGDLAERWRVPRAPLVTAAVVMLTALGLRSWVQLGYWRDSITVWTHARQVAGPSLMTDYNLGLAYSDEAERASAELEQQGQSRQALQRRRALLEQAAQFYKKATDLEPTFADAHNNLGVTYALLERPAEAIEQLDMALRLNPDLEQARQLRDLLERGGAPPSQ